MVLSDLSKETSLSGPGVNRMLTPYLAKILGDQSLETPFPSGAVFFYYYIGNFPVPVQLTAIKARSHAPGAVNGFVSFGYVLPGEAFNLNAHMITSLYLLNGITPDTEFSVAVTNNQIPANAIIYAKVSVKVGETLCPVVCGLTFAGV